jgi:hypothetical protein
LCFLLCFFSRVLFLAPSFTISSFSRPDTQQFEGLSGATVTEQYPIANVVPGDFNYDGHQDVLVSGPMTNNITKLNEGYYLHIYLGALTSLGNRTQTLALFLPVALFISSLASPFLLSCFPSFLPSLFPCIRPSFALGSLINVLPVADDQVLVMDYNNDLRLDLYGSVKGNRTQWINSANSDADAGFVYTAYVHSCCFLFPFQSCSFFLILYSSSSFFSSSSSVTQFDSTVRDFPLASPHSNAFVDLVWVPFRSFSLSPSSLPSPLLLRVSPLPRMAIV